MACYTVRWNPFHPRVFLTCSADWTVKLWEMGTSQPIMTFDLMTPVADIAWAPYSSTVFAVITSDVLVSRSRSLARSAGAAGKKYYYMCTRNNSFSNRSQKGTIIVDP